MVKKYSKRYSPYARSGKKVMIGRPKLVSARAARKGKSLVRQVKALIASKKKDAADVTRATADASATTVACLTSTTNFATAASGTGLLDLDGDECLINSVHIKGYLNNSATLVLDPSAYNNPRVRKILVWFNKPLLVASAAGTLPPITEVLISDSVDSLKVTPAANGGRFQILSDKTFDVGSNTYQAATALGHARCNGKTMHTLDYRVKINKMCKFAANSVSGTPAGHYDSDVGPGRIDKGLLCLYTLYSLFGAASTVDDSVVTRLNYTG